MKQVKTDPDHKALEDNVLGEREYEDGGWSIFERWAGVSWFQGHNPLKERYGTIRSDTGSRFPIIDKVKGLDEKTEECVEKYQDFDEKEKYGNDTRNSYTGGSRE